MNDNTCIFMLHIRRFSACILAYARTYIVQSCTYPPDGSCIAPDTIAYAKVSGADSIAWRTQMHLTPALQQQIESFHFKYNNKKINKWLSWKKEKFNLNYFYFENTRAKLINISMKWVSNNFHHTLILETLFPVCWLTNIMSKDKKKLHCYIVIFVH